MAKKKTDKKKNTVTKKARKMAKVKKKLSYQEILSDNRRLLELIQDKRADILDLEKENLCLGENREDALNKIATGKYTEAHSYKGMAELMDGIIEACCVSKDLLNKLANATEANAILTTQLAEHRICPKI